jgi:hypothetical protein
MMFSFRLCNRMVDIGSSMNSLVGVLVSVDRPFQANAHESKAFVKMSDFETSGAWRDETMAALEGLIGWTIEDHDRVFLGFPLPNTDDARWAAPTRPCNLNGA